MAKYLHACWLPLLLATCGLTSQRYYVQTTAINSNNQPTEQASTTTIDRQMHNTKQSRAQSKQTKTWTNRQNAKLMNVPGISKGAGGQGDKE